MKQIEDESKSRTNKQLVAKEATRAGNAACRRLLLLYVDDEVPDITPFGDVPSTRSRSCHAKPYQIAGQR